jgi:undecaprenyl-diphosphatase
MRFATYPGIHRESLHWQVWGLLVLAAVALTALASQGVFIPGDVEIARAVQGLHGFEPLQPVSEAIYHFGLAPIWPAVTVLAAAGLWLKRQPLAAALIVLTGLLRPISLLLKEIVERPRPSGDLLPVIEGASGYSFPSGHVFGTVLLVGRLAWLVLERETDRARRRLIAGCAAAVIVLMGLQRVYAGAHWPTDAVAGWLWGGLVLFALLQAYRWAGHRAGRRTPHAAAGLDQGPGARHDIRRDSPA